MTPGLLSRAIRRMKLPSTKVVKAEGWTDSQKKNSLVESIFRWLLKIQVKLLSHSLDIEVWILQGKSELEIQMQEFLGIDGI